MNIKDNKIDIIISILIGLLLSYIFKKIYRPPIVVIKGNSPSEVERIIYKDEVKNKCFKLKSTTTKCELPYEI